MNLAGEEYQIYEKASALELFNKNISHANH